MFLLRRFVNDDAAREKPPYITFKFNFRTCQDQLTICEISLLLAQADELSFVCRVQEEEPDIWEPSQLELYTSCFQILYSLVLQSLGQQELD
jgi:hypothetical protein